MAMSMVGNMALLGAACLYLAACSSPQQMDANAAESAKADGPIAVSPPLISKLRYVQDQSTSWILVPGFLRDDGAVPMKFENTEARKNVAGAADPIRVGETFFEEGAGQGRFKYLGHENQTRINPAIQVEEVVTVVRIEDQKPNKAGMIYEIPAPLFTRHRKPYIQHDRSAVLALEALGQGEAQVVIEEFTHFSLPFGQDERPYFLKSVSPEAIVVEWSTHKGLNELRIERGSPPTEVK